MKEASNPHLTLVTGGAKSGKSRYALALCESLPGQKIFLATAQAGDEEMARRIRLHREGRGDQWQTLEEPLDLCSALAALAGQNRVVLLDCITLWLSNLLTKHGQVPKIIGLEIDRLVDALASCAGPVVVVSNEVGMGIVPLDSLSRLYRDLAGEANQKIAARAGNVVAMFSGIPLVIKGSLNYV
jgi:adenosylcobinamide kinase/adenosylcobinamide-phosphate guanylyltransferase